MVKNTEVVLVNKSILKDKIYIIRGQKVMIDRDLAMIYGYSTKRFNEQVQRNIEKFDKDFMFQLSKDEAAYLSRSHFATLKDEYTNSSRCKNFTLKKDVQSNLLGSKILTLNISNNKRGFNIKYKPYAFTEKGVYMLMTVLKGPLATKQSIALIRIFDSMKNFIIDNSQLLTHSEALRLSLKNKEEIDEIKETMATKDDINNIKKELNIINTEFIEEDNIKSFIIFSNTKFELDEFYSRFFKKAKESVIVIDNYISIKTLNLLTYCKNNISIKLITDKASKSNDKLKEHEYKDFIKEHPEYTIKLIDSKSINHDRFIILDYSTKSQKFFSSGSSLKDAGSKVSTIVELKDILLPKEIIDLIEKGEEYIWDK